MFVTASPGFYFAVNQPINQLCCSMFLRAVYSLGDSPNSSAVEFKTTPRSVDGGSSHSHDDPDISRDDPPPGDASDNSHLPQDSPENNSLPNNSSESRGNAENRNPPQNSSINRDHMENGSLPGDSLENSSPPGDSLKNRNLHGNSLENNSPAGNSLDDLPGNSSRNGGLPENSLKNTDLAADHSENIDLPGNSLRDRHLPGNSSQNGDPPGNSSDPAGDFQQNGDRPGDSAENSNVVDCCDPLCGEDRSTTGSADNYSEMVELLGQNEDGRKFPPKPSLDESSVLRRKDGSVNISCNVSRIPQPKYDDCTDHSWKTLLQHRR